ncbi:hypothetical protein SUGI_0178830 [Cryptomeria japonica]|uniref:uncharacterized GPI-anchored protein At4g28100 n=1 Tax=Cryptomeria japonica TaxID=3369 RepID=UPI002408D398|nr:uncharacterized GPI-anchored protein At4g28100 [Cryptomeria japonica]GLJ11865.1 hypothetical protein SUGI_0178830 [Cryptomeria japonica]
MESPKNYFAVIQFLIIRLVFLHSVLATENSSSSVTFQPLNPNTANLIPAIPVQSEIEACPLDLTEGLFSSIKGACKELNRNKCCPVLAAWLYAAHAKTALRSLRLPISEDSPVLPDDSHKCVNNFQSALHGRGIHIPQPNETCDPVLCFCGIRLHQISTLTCPQAFNVSTPLHHVTASPSVRALEDSCRKPTYSGCSTCLTALHQLNEMTEVEEISDRTSRIYSRDCELMGLTWLLAKNKTAYIPTVSAVFKALFYSGLPPHTTTCSANRQKMPLPVDSTQLSENAAGFTTPKAAMMTLVLCIFHVTVKCFSPYW